MLDTHIQKPEQRRESIMVERDENCDRVDAPFEGLLKRPQIWASTPRGTDYWIARSRESAQHRQERPPGPSARPLQAPQGQ